MKSGLKGGYFAEIGGTKAFWVEYEAFLSPEIKAGSDKPIRSARGSIVELVERYVAVPERLGPSEVTQAKIRAVIEDFCNGENSCGVRRGTFPAALVAFEAIDKIIAKKLVKTGIGNKTKGGIHAARKLRKELFRLFAFAVKIGMCEKNPVEMAEKVKAPKASGPSGFHSWTEVEIDQFRNRWPLGTRERLALELYLWTDQRRCDVYRMGRAHIQKSRIQITQQKTGKVLWIALAPQLLAAINALPKELVSPFCFIVSRKGTAYTKESFGNWFKDACVFAGLPHCNGHGLRKAMLRRMAELEKTNKTMKSVSGQTRDDTLAGYIESANQMKLADGGITAVARWEMTKDEGHDDGEYRFAAKD